MSESRLRPELISSTATGRYKPTGGTAYLMVYNAVQSKERLAHGKLHALGESCAIGSFWDVNKNCTLDWSFIDEVAAVNDSVPKSTPRQRRLVVLRWLRWKLQQAGMPGFHSPTKRAKRPTR